MIFRPRQKGQTTVEYTLLVCCIALPLSLMFFKWTQSLFARIIVHIVNLFTGYPD